MLRTLCTDHHEQRMQHVLVVSRVPVLGVMNRIVMLRLLIHWGEGP